MHGSQETGGDPDFTHVQTRSSNSHEGTFASREDVEEDGSTEASDDLLCDAVLLSIFVLHLRVQWHAGVLNANTAMIALDRAVRRVSAGRSDRRIDFETKRQWSAAWGNDWDSPASG
jgi:hypothetical protein